VTLSADSKSWPDLITYQALAKTDLSRHHLEKLIAAGKYERLAPGVFVHSGVTDDTTAAWMGIASRKPTATVCLISAASIHDLTDEVPRATDIAIPRGTHPMKIDYPPIIWHSFASNTFNIGRETYKLPGDMTIGMYSAARTVIDLFKLRHDKGNDLAVEALKRWLRTRANKPSVLLDMATHFPNVRPTIQSTLEILL
jgi:predicted transcriptional regulator of viral defense system